MYWIPWLQYTVKKTVEIAQPCHRFVSARFPSSVVMRVLIKSNIIFSEGSLRYSSENASAGYWKPFPSGNTERRKTVGNPPCASSTVFIRSLRWKVNRSHIQTKPRNSVLFELTWATPFLGVWVCWNYGKGWTNQAPAHPYYWCTPSNSWVCAVCDVGVVCVICGILRSMLLSLRQYGPREQVPKASINSRRCQC